MTIKIEQAGEGVPQEELEFFIKGEKILKLEPIFNMWTLMLMRNLVLQVFQCSRLTCAGNLSLEKSRRKKPCHWLPEQGWEDLVKLAELFPEVFNSLPDDVERNLCEWRSVRKPGSSPLSSVSR